jgi:hypothetical protein
MSLSYRRAMLDAFAHLFSHVDRAAPIGNVVPLGAVYLTEWKPSHLACTTRGSETLRRCRPSFILIKKALAQRPVAGQSTL